MSNQTNILTTASAGVEAQQKALTEARVRVNNAKDAYLSSVVDTALATEKVIRQKGKMAVLIGILGGLLLGIILTIINIVVGIIYFVGFIAIIFLSTRTSDERTSNYNSRKEFFVKYSYSIPTNEPLRWKGVTYSGSPRSIQAINSRPINSNAGNVSQSTPMVNNYQKPTGANFNTATQEATWKCPKCGNGPLPANCNFCNNCGTKKP